MGHEEVRRRSIERPRRAVLLQHAALQHRHPVAHRHRLGLVVRDVQRRGPDRPVHPQDLRAHLHAELGVQVGQWLVHQEHAGGTNDRPAHRHPLPLTAGQLLRLAAEQIRQAEDPGGRTDPPVSFGLLDLLVLQREADVLIHRQVRVERVVLEDHGDVAVPGRHVVDHAVAEADRARRDPLQARDHPQRRRLAAARGPDQHDELPVVDVQVQTVQRDDAGRVDLGQSAQRNRRHDMPPRLSSRCCRAACRRASTAAGSGTARSAG